MKKSRSGGCKWTFGTMGVFANAHFAGFKMAAKGKPPKKAKQNQMRKNAKDGRGGGKNDKDACKWAPAEKPCFLHQIAAFVERSMVYPYSKPYSSIPLPALNGIDKPNT